MKLTVKNLGAVSEAEIDLDKRLLIFTGENNTGKTYLSYTIYQLYRFRLNIGHLYEGLTPTLSAQERIIVRQNEKYEITLLDVIKPKSHYLSDFQKFISDGMAKEMSDFFSAPNGIFNSVQIDFKIKKKDISEQAILDLEITNQLVDLTFNKTQKTPNVIFSGIFTQNEANNNLEKDITNTVKNMVFFLLHEAIFNGSYIFPAEREGMNFFFNKESLLFRNNVFQKLISDKKQELANLLNRYTQPVIDAFNEQNNYDVSKLKTSNFAHLAKELEDTFLKGDIVLNTEGDILFKPKNMDKPLDIHLTSSTVKSLSSLIVYLRHTAEKGDSIIIDEPELNLHPDNQRKIARFFGRLINEGFKVLISTHSDYIVRELNNLIMLSHGVQSKKEEVQRLLTDYNYKENELIAADKVGVYLFRVGQPVECVTVEDTGFNVATIDEEIRKLNQSSQDIYITLFDS